MALEFIDRKRARWIQGKGVGLAAGSDQVAGPVAARAIVPGVLEERFASVLRRAPPCCRPEVPGEVLAALAEGGP
eukprot:6863056-Pyramimonas_sp.AAC.1